MYRIIALLLLLSLPLNAQVIIFGDSFENTPPVIISSPVTMGAAGEIYTYDVDAFDFNGDLLAYYLLISPAGMEMDAVTGEINWTPNGSGDFPVSVEVSDGQRGFANQSWSIAVIPPNPEDVATENDPLLTTVFDSTEFLYTGDNPIQTGVEEGTIVPVRVAVIRGNVMTRDGAALPGATISILNHEEFGQTLSRIDGAFDMVVNGGGHLTINYFANGYLPAQRQLRLPWQDYIIAPDVALVPLDPIVTTIDMNAGAMQMAEGSMESDVDGERHAMILFPPGTTAELVMPDGSVQPISSLSVRATEYTVGPNGPAAMPGELPPASGYTYAVELSADEAMAVGASRVSFNQPLPFYVENFLGFPVGGPVPTGFYDRDKAAWIPSDNGRVIKLISITGSLAEIDTTGDEVADNGADIGMTAAERQQLASLYTAGQSLWRMLIPHFSPWDANWPFGPPDDAEEPNQSRPFEESSIEEGICYADGSIIEAQNQTLGESVRVTGTPFTLNYSSERTPARLTGNRLIVSLSGASVPASLKRIDLKINVAGQNHLFTFPSDADQTTLFTWDNLDAFGRPVQGIQKISGSIGYVYDGVYQNTTGRFGYGGNGIAIEGSRTRREVSLLQPFETSIGNWDARGQGLGGWTLDVHHFYDPVSKTIYMGDGRRRGADSLPRIIDTVVTPTAKFLSQGITVAPDGSLYFVRNASDGTVTIHRLDPDGIETLVAGGGFAGEPDFGDNGPATEARLIGPIRNLALGGDGGLYIGEGSTVRKVGRDGIIRRVAGLHNIAGGAGCDTEGGVATETQFCGLAGGMAVSADGTIYVITAFDPNKPRWYIRRIGPDGIADTIAGGSGKCNRFNNINDPCGDGGPAIDATFEQLQAITVADDGSIYVSDYCNIRRIGADGMIKKYAGGYSSRRCTNGNGVIEGGDAQDTWFGQSYGMAWGINGLYMSNTHGRIWLIESDNTVTRFAGTGTPSNNTDQTGDTGPALAAKFGGPRTLALAPDGSLYFHSGGGRSIRKVGHLLSGVEEASIFIASQDGGELYAFDASGRHLQTLHALTGATLYEFDYDSDGRLSRVIEKTGGTDNITTIEHDDSGNPTRIIGPFGQQTALTVDANGYLASVTNPVGESLSIISSPGGLITQTTDPRGRISDYGYDNLGRLTSQSDNADYSQVYSRTSSATEFEVTRSTGLLRTVAYKLETLTNDSEQQTITAPDDSQTLSLRNVNSGEKSSSSADGTLTSIELGPDPRFGMQAPLIASLSITIPSGPVFSASTTGTAVLSDSTDILSLESLTETVTINGQAGADTYTAATRTLTSTSPTGRSRTITYDGLGQLVSHQVADLYPTTVSYDSRGRPLSVALGSGVEERSIGFTYGTYGFLETLTDPLGRSVQFNRDAAGRPIQKILPGGLSVVLGRNAAGDMTSLTPPGKPQHNFGYDLKGSLVSYTPPSVTGSGPTTYEYNDDRQLTSINRPGDETISFNYNASGLIGTITLTDSGGPNTTYTLNYNIATLLGSVVGPGSQTVSYDYQGALITGVTWSGAVEGNVGRTYNNNFRVATESVNGVSTVAFTYDADDLLAGAGDLIITRDPDNGLPQSTTLGLVSDGWTHNGFGETVSYRATANGADLYVVSYEYDVVGRITEKTETIGGTTSTYVYSYDERGQLGQVTRDGQIIESYGYDDNGNRTSATVSGVSIDAIYDDQDRLVTYGSTSYNYSPAGRLLTRTGSGNQVTQFDYDVIGNLLGVTLPVGTNITYGLDGADRRVLRQVDNTVTEQFLYAGFQPVAQLDGTGAMVSRFVYSSDIVPAYMTRDGVAYRIITDQNGSVRLVVNTATGDIKQRIDYDSFGNVTQDTNPGFQPFGFAGGLYDPVTGLVRFGFRDYEPRTGRWTAKDPIGFSGGDTNLYRYVSNDPVNFIDPSGLDGWDTLSGILHGLTGLLNPMYTVTKMSEDITELILDLTIGDWLDETFGPYDTHRQSKLMYPPFPHVDETDYETGDFIGNCIGMVGAGAVGLASKVASAVRSAAATKSALEAASRAKYFKMLENVVKNQVFKGKDSQLQVAQVNRNRDIHKKIVEARKIARARKALSNDNLHDHGQAANVKTHGY